MDKNNKISLLRASSPEEAGVSSKVIGEFLEAVEETKTDIHSFMVIRHGKVAAECFRAPFTPERPHTMYSVSKTVTATAIGIAQDEGLLSLDDYIKDIFPDYTKDIEDENLDKLQIKHLITMTSGKNPSVFADKTKGSWIGYFFSSPWYNEPGKEFKYVNENIYMLSVIIKRKTGLHVREYLKDRLFEPLGIDYPFWETDAYGNEAGGWGLYLKTEDLAKIMLVYSNKGTFNGKRLLSEEWVNYSSSALVDNSSEDEYDAKVGYGCCMWRCADFNGYRADGMFSQFGIVFEDFDAVLVVTASVVKTQECRNLLWKFFPKAFEDADKGEDTSCEGLKERLENAVLDTAYQTNDSSIEEIISRQEIRFRKKIILNLIGFPMSMLPLAVTYMTTDRAGNIDRMVFDFDNDTKTLTWSEGDERNTIPIGFNGRYCYGSMRLGQINYKVCSTAKWLERDRLYVQIRPIETIGKRMLDIRFKDKNKVHIKPYSTPSVYAIAMNLAPGFEKMIGNKRLTDRIIPLFRFAPNLIEPTMKGKFVNKIR